MQEAVEIMAFYGANVLAWHLKIGTPKLLVFEIPKELYIWLGIKTGSGMAGRGRTLFL